jgi:hypothetical protein
MESAMKSVSLLRAFVAVAVVAWLGTACADYQYSRIVGTRYHRVPIDTYPLQIVRVDERQAPLNPREPTLVEPGLHNVVVATYPSPTSRLGDEKTMQLQVEPCTQYYLVAVKSTRVSRDYEVRIDHQERVPGCTPPAPKG